MVRDQQIKNTTEKNKKILEIQKPSQLTVHLGTMTGALWTPVMRSYIHFEVDREKNLEMNLSLLCLG